MLCAVPYGNFRVEVYEHANNFRNTTLQRQKKYFYKPIALLDHRSAVSQFNNVTKQPQLRFNIHMWNEKIEREVAEFVSKMIGHRIEDHQVQVIFLEKVVLSNTVPSSVYSVPSNWMPYQLQKSLQFSVSCYQQSDCDQLTDEMRSRPDQFDHFQLLFSLSAQTSQIRETFIRVDSVVSGDMVSSLLHQRFENQVYLTAEDEKKLFQDKKLATNVIVETFEDSDVISPKTELQIYNILKDLLVTSRTIIKDQSDKMWDSVFWNEDNYRPDKVSKTLNEVFSKLDTYGKPAKIHRDIPE